MLKAILVTLLIAAILWSGISLLKRTADNIKPPKDFKKKADPYADKDAEDDY